jgi:hypothetical protein
MSSRNYIILSSYYFAELKALPKEIFYYFLKNEEFAT